MWQAVDEEERVSTVLGYVYESEAPAGSWFRFRLLSSMTTTVGQDWPRLAWRPKTS